MQRILLNGIHKERGEITEMASIKTQKLIQWITGRKLQRHKEDLKLGHIFKWLYSYQITIYCIYIY